MSVLHADAPALRERRQREVGARRYRPGGVCGSASGGRGRHGSRAGASSAWATKVLPPARPRAGVPSERLHRRGLTCMAATATCTLCVSADQDVFSLRGTDKYDPISRDCPVSTRLTASTEHFPPTLFASMHRRFLPAQSFPVSFNTPVPQLEEVSVSHIKFAGKRRFGDGDWQARALALRVLERRANSWQSGGVGSAG